MTGSMIEALRRALGGVTSKAAGADDDGRRRQAWLQAMERALRPGWLGVGAAVAHACAKPGLVRTPVGARPTGRPEDPGGQRDGSPAPRSAGGRGAGKGAQEPLDERWASEGLAQRQVQAFQPWMAGPDIALALVPQIPAASGDSGGAVDGVRQPAVSPAVEGYLAGSTVLPELTTSGAAELEPLMERALERASETSTGTRLGPGDPIRWHAEWTEQGLRVWIGADAGVGPALDTLVAILIDEVRRHAEARGSRLLSFVCNGRTVDSAVPGSVPSLERSPTTIVSPTCSISPAVNVRPSEEP